MIPIPPPERVTTVADIITTALAPVFLLAGIGGFLNVLTGRLARSVDRAREIEPLLLRSRGEEHDRFLGELKTLDRRMKLVGRAIWLTVLAAVLICLVVVLLFAGTLVKGHFGRAIAVLFMLCMLLLGLGFGVFLVETRISARATRVHNSLLEHQVEDKS